MAFPNSKAGRGKGEPPDRFRRSTALQHLDLGLLVPRTVGEEASIVLSPWYEFLVTAALKNDRNCLAAEFFFFSKQKQP